MKTLLLMSAVLLLSGLTAGCVEELSTAHESAATNQKKPTMIESHQQQPMNWCSTKQELTSRQKCEELMAYGSY